MQLKEFLQTVLPSQGMKCCAVIYPNKVVKHSFTDSIDTLAQQVELLGKTEDTYFACASFGTEQRRTSTNAAYCKSFWMDLDVGESKEYNTTQEAISAVDDFCNRLDLPLPMVVRSGRGVHVYWVLASEVTAADWLPVAQTLKRVSQQLGLRADPTRTADLASILRPPHTFNFKGQPPLPVYVEDDSYEPITLDSFSAKLLAAPANSVPDINRALSGGSKTQTHGVGEGGRNNAITSFAGRCLAKGMTVEDTYQECLKVNETYQPPLEPREIRISVESVAKREADKGTKYTPPPIHVEGESHFSIPSAVGPFRHSQSKQLVMDWEDGEGHKKCEVISPFPIYLYDVCTSDTDAGTAYVFHHCLPHDGWKEFTVSAKDFYSQNMIGVMADKGAKIRNKLFKNYVETAEVKLMQEKKSSPLHDQFGWKDRNTNFLIGSTLYTPTGIQHAFGDKALSSRMPLFKLTSGTSLSAWSTAANRLFSPGFEAHSVAVIASFASILLPFCIGATDGGLVLALYSRGSGRGKTRSLEAAASVWGNFDALSIVNRDTNNAMFKVISQSGSLPNYMEEITQRDPQKVCEFLKEFTSGRDKNRSQKDGSVIHRNTRFQNILITASNLSIYDVAKQGRDEGAVARVFELAFSIKDNDKVFKEFTRITREMLNNSGHAGRAFLKALMQPGVLDWAIMALEKTCVYYWDTLKAVGEHRYIVMFVAVNYVTSLLLNKYNILEFAPKRVADWTLERALERIGDKVGVDVEDVLGQFINDHWFETVIADINHHPTRPCVITHMPTGRSIAMRYEFKNRKLYISIDSLRQWFRLKGYVYTDIERELLDKEVLRDRRRRTSLAGGTELDLGRVQCWEIDTSHDSIAPVIRVIENKPAVVDNALVKKR